MTATSYYSQERFRVWSYDVAIAELAQVTAAIPSEYRWVVEFMSITGRTSAEACSLSVDRVIESDALKSEQPLVTALSPAEEAFLVRYVTEMRLPLLRYGASRLDKTPSEMFLDSARQPITAQTLNKSFRQVGRQLGLSMLTTPDSVRSLWLRRQIAAWTSAIVHQVSAGHCVRMLSDAPGNANQLMPGEHLAHGSGHCEPCAWNLPHASQLLRSVY
ncbi:hypothetical protein BMW22_04405 [Rhizobium leguminosarum]|uniref:Integrase n=1 Tax=Rhizobium leguminosarum TaxID=384 RepID=A0A1L3Z5Q2_RHILE|nr:hypothetical protein BMW22_04405 [Rhizobium leguminosarum]